MAKTEALTRQQIELSIKKKEFFPIYVLSGEEPFYVDKLSEMIIDNALTEEEKDFNLSVYYASDTRMADVALACRRYPMMAERQVVVLREAQAWKSMNGVNEKKELEILESYAEKPTASTVLVVCYKGATLKSPNLTKILAKTMPDGRKAGIYFESKKIPEYSIGSNISEYVRSVGCTIDDKALAMLTEYLGNDMSRIVKEIDKLKMISPNGIRITPEMVEQNIGISKEYNNFELIKAIATRNKVKTLKIINYFRENPKKNPTVMTSTLLFNYFSNMLIAHYARTTDEHKLMEALRLKSPYALKDYRLGMPNYNATRCLRIIEAIREFDAKSKGIGSQQNEYDLFFDLITKIFYA